MTRLLTHERRQHAVGQGFFHSGSVSVGGKALRYVYDCGSEKPRALRRSVQSFCEELNGDQIDVLFISHLHSDHVAGLDILLALTTAKVVVLPYLSPVELLLAVAQATASETLSGSFIDAICDPAAWLVDRGAQTIIYMSDQPATGEAIARTEFDQSQVKEGGDELVLYLDGLRRGLVNLPGGRRTKAEVLRSYHAENLSIRDRGTPINWMFRTFVHRESHDKVTAFGALVAKMLREVSPAKSSATGVSRLSRRPLVALLQDPASREKLKHAYASIQQKLNRTSMSVYSGPRRHEVGMRTTWHLWSSTSGRWCDETVWAAGWLGTGDAELADDQRRSQFFEHFSGQIAMVVTLAVPHHGSKLNFHEELLDKIAPCAVTVAAGKANRHGHPDEPVVRAIMRHDIPFCVTTEEMQSEVRELVRQRHP